MIHIVISQSPAWGRMETSGEGASTTVYIMRY